MRTDRGTTTKDRETTIKRGVRGDGTGDTPSKAGFERTPGPV